MNNTVEENNDIVKRTIIMVEDKENLLSIGRIEKLLMGSKKYDMLRRTFVTLLKYANDGTIDYRRLYEDMDSLPIELYDFLALHTENHCPPDMERDVLLGVIFRGKAEIGALSDA